MAKMKCVIKKKGYRSWVCSTNYLLKQNISNEEMSMWFELATEVTKDIRVVEQILPSVYNCVDCNNKEIKD